MDEETINVLLLTGGVIALGVCTAFLLTMAAAWSHTRAWQEARVQSSTPSSSPLLPSKQPPEYTDDLSDSEIEDIQAAEREAVEDVGLTTRQKFWKEFGLVWNPARTKAKIERETRKREREERKKLAREVVRQLRRQE